jgi:hypothetical protein
MRRYRRKRRSLLVNWTGLAPAEKLTPPIFVTNFPFSQQFRMLNQSLVDQSLLGNDHYIFNYYTTAVILSV